MLAVEHGAQVVRLGGGISYDAASCASGSGSVLPGSWAGHQLLQLGEKKGPEAIAGPPPQESIR
jgi:hypothetical protein